MNEVLRVIEQRYSCRDFKDECVSKEDIECIVKAGLQAPSGINQQPWKIIVVTNKKLLEEMDEVAMKHFKNMGNQSWYERMMSRGGRVFYNAPCMIIIAKKDNKNLDCGIITENIALAASSLGLGNVICGMAAIPFEINHEYKELIPEGYEFGMSVLIGHANMTKQPHEIDMTKVTYVE